MNRTLPPRRDVVIGHAAGDGSIDVFVDFVQADGALVFTDVVEAEWTAFYGLDGEKLVPVLGKYEWIERLVPAGAEDLSGLVGLLSEYATRHRFETDGGDPAAFVDELVRRNYDSRCPRWPGWLDRWLHGKEPRS